MNGRPFADTTTPGRPFTHTGPGQASLFVTPAFARQLAEMDQERPVEKREQRKEARVERLPHQGAGGTTRLVRFAMC